MLREEKLPFLWAGGSGRGKGDLNTLEDRDLLITGINYHEMDF